MFSSIFISPNPSLFHTPFFFFPDLQFHKHKKRFKQAKIFNSNNHFKNFHSSSIDSDVSSSYSSPRENPDGGYVSFDDDSPSTSSTADDFVGDGRVLAGYLQRCCGVKEVERVHAAVVKSGDRFGAFVGNNLISAYVRIGKLVEAREVFDKMTERNVVSWTAIICGYLRYGFEDEGLRLFFDLLEGGFRPNSKTLVCVFDFCSRRLDFDLGRQLHARVAKGNFHNVILDSAVVHFYAQCGYLTEAFCVFDRMEERDVICWTTMITACSQHGRGEDAFLLFSRMFSHDFVPNEFTVCNALKACANEKALSFGRQLHGGVVKKVFKNDVFVGTSLVDMYAKCGQIKDSKTVFDGMRRRNMVTWTSIIAGYARNGLGVEAIRLFRVMKKRKISANKLTLVSILRACGLVRSLKTGKEVHAQIIKNHFQGNIYLESSLIWLYWKCGEHTAARSVLKGMTFRDVVSWTAMISGCANTGHELEALEFMNEMSGDGVEPNPFTYSSALKACAKLENVGQGKSIHSSISKTCAFSNVYVGSSLINMYAKCGYVFEAIEVFDKMPERNLVAWKSMIVGYAMNGLCEEAIKLMYRMQEEGFEVDDYILSTVLTTRGNSESDTEHSTACSQTST